MRINLRHPHAIVRDRVVCITIMGIDHGGGDKSPRISSRDDANANCPPQILSYRYKKERSVAFKICQNPFSAGALARAMLSQTP